MPGIPLSRRSRPAEVEPVAPVVAAEPVIESKPAPVKPRRARDDKGRLMADDPKTPDVNEAFDTEAG